MPSFDKFHGRRLRTEFLLDNRGNIAIAKQQIHLFQRLALRLGEEERITDHRDHVERKENIEVPEPNTRQGIRRELSEDQIDSPVGKSGDRVTLVANIDGEDLSRVYPGDDTDESVEEAEDKVHGHHGAQLVFVAVVVVLGHGRVRN